MNIRPIRTPEDYGAALKMIDKYWASEEGTENSDYFEILCALIMVYEKENRPVDLPDPIEALKYYMQQDGHPVEELGLILKDQTLAQKILGKSASLTLPVVYQLYKHWEYPPVSFLNPYKLISDPLREKTS